jgi:hypothetical protein
MRINDLLLCPLHASAMPRPTQVERTSAYQGAPGSVNCKRSPQSALATPHWLLRIGKAHWHSVHAGLLRYHQSATDASAITELN